MLIVILLILSTICVGVLASRTWWCTARYRFRLGSHTEQDAALLPSVSVCIAARNETHALAQCLERVLRSDYKKLEILVLDDSSTDDTSLIIKSFAQAGVRFVAGSALPSGWLGKNHAYQTLINESSGEYVLFLDVDTTITTTTISQLVATLQASKQSMISVLPRREDSYRASALLGTMRYYWELLLSTTTSPPAASALWMVRRRALEDAGVGLFNYSMSVRPERHLARQLRSRYQYVIGTKQLGVGYEKRLLSQYETALRLYYPATGRRLFSWVVAAIFVSLLILPLGILLWSLAIDVEVLVRLWSLILCAVTGVTFGVFASISTGKSAWILRTIVGPWLLIQEFILLTLSYVLYKMNKVTWKGRQVLAQPVRHDALRIEE